MPIRGHSGVQGGAEMGCYATALPGGVPVDAENAARARRAVGLRGPDRAGPDRAGDARRRPRAASSTSCSPPAATSSRCCPTPTAVRDGARRGSRCASTWTSSLSQPDAGRARRGRPAAAGDDALRDPRRRHRDDDRAPGHLQPRDPGPADRRGAAGVGGASASSRRARGPELAERVRFAGTAGDPRRDRARSCRSTRDRGAARAGRLVPVRRPAPLRGLASSRPPTAGRTSRRSPLPRAGRRRRPLRALDPARQAVQLDGPGAQRRAHRRRARGGPDQRRRRRAARARRRRRGACVRSDAASCAAASRSRRSRPATSRSTGPRATS